MLIRLFATRVCSQSTLINDGECDAFHSYFILSTAVTGNANRGTTREDIGTLGNSAVLA